MSETENTENTTETAAAADAPSASARGRRQVKVGRVISAKMDKTVVVSVEKTVMHRLYHRLMKKSSRFRAHDEANDCREGDLVSLVSTRPLSKTKRWKVQSILERARG